MKRSSIFLFLVFTMILLLYSCAQVPDSNAPVSQKVLVKVQVNRPAELQQETKAYISEVDKVFLEVYDSTDQLMYSASTNEKKNIVFDIELPAAGTYTFQAEAKRVDGSVVFHGSRTVSLIQGQNQVIINTVFKNGELRVTVDIDPIVWGRYEVESASVEIVRDTTQDSSTIVLTIDNPKTVDTREIYPDIYTLKFRISLKARYLNLDPERWSNEASPVTVSVPIDPDRITDVEFTVYFENNVINAAAVVTNVTVPYAEPVENLSAIWSPFEEKLYLEWYHDRTDAEFYIYKEISDRYYEFVAKTRERKYEISGFDDEQFQRISGVAVNAVVDRKSSGFVVLKKNDITPVMELKWKVEIPNFTISPSISPDGTIYVADSRTLYAINPSDGSIKWTWDVEEGYFTSNYGVCPVVGSDGTIYICTEKFIYSEEQSTWICHVCAVDPNGTLKWRYEINDRGSIPAIGSDGTVYVAANASLYAINPDGTLKWMYTHEQIESSTVETSSPIVGSDGTVYFSASYTDSSTEAKLGYLYAVDPSNGQLKWNFSFDQPVSPFLAMGSNETLYVCTYDPNRPLEYQVGCLYAINPNGTLKWKYELNYYPLQPIVDFDGTLYLSGGKIDYQLNRFIGFLIALNPDGTLKWQKEVDNHVLLTPALGSNDILYVPGVELVDPYTALKGYLFVIDPKQGEILWRFELEDIIWDWLPSFPTIAPDGTIYILDRYQLYAIRSVSRGLADSPWPKFRKNVRNTGNVLDN